MTTATPELKDLCGKTARVEKFGGKYMLICGLSPTHGGRYCMDLDGKTSFLPDGQAPADPSQKDTK